MDANRFDTLTRTCLERPSRRGMLLGMASGLLASLPLALSREAVAKKKGKGKKKKKNAPPPPPGPTCSDGVKNGDETDLDCGGPDCPPCANGRLCTSNTDCGTARCGDGLGAGDTCQSCTSDGVCGSDDNGGCLCDSATGACFSDVTPTEFVQTGCPVCPLGSACRVFFDGFACVPLCGG